MTTPDLEAIEERWEDGYPGQVFKMMPDIAALLEHVKAQAETIQRLRDQNKQSSDAWTKRVAQLQSYRDNWENLKQVAHRYLV